jgi:hypothetical protein
MRINVLSPIKRSLPLVIFSAFLAFTTPAKAEDNIFTSAEFLKWEEKSQDFFIEASVGMAGFLAAQIDKEKQQAKCIGDWYYLAENKKNEYIRSIMRKNSEFHPRAIIVGILEKECGEF